MVRMPKKWLIESREQKAGIRRSKFLNIFSQKTEQEKNEFLFDLMLRIEEIEKKLTKLKNQNLRS